MSKRRRFFSVSFVGELIGEAAAGDEYTITATIEGEPVELSRVRFAKPTAGPLRVEGRAQLGDPTSATAIVETDAPGLSGGPCERIVTADRFAEGDHWPGLDQLQASA